MFLECLPVVCVCICLRQVNGKQGIKRNTFERITMATRDVYCLTLLSQCCCDNNFFNGHRERSKGFSCCVEGLQCMVNCDIHVIPSVAETSIRTSAIVIHRKQY